MSTPVTFLTGASSGIGMALAPLFAAEGHAVALVARRKDKVQALADEIIAGGGSALAIECDVGDKAAVFAAVKRCEEKLGPIERLVANAGIGITTPAARFSADDFETVQRTNVLGVAYCIEAVLPAMIERGSGHLVGVCSLAAYRGLKYQAAYCASKSAVTAMLESMRIDLKKRGIKVTTIHPGFIKTAMTADNTHAMPFILELDDAAGRIHKAIVRQKKIFAFPWPLATMVRVALVLPATLYDWVAKKFM